MKPKTDAFCLSERRGPLSRKTAWLAIRAHGTRAGLPVDAHPHRLRHACGCALADQGADARLMQAYLGHRHIQHTVQYTATNPARFARLWRSGESETGMSEDQERFRRYRPRADVAQRRRVIVALLRQHPDGLTAREIGEATGVSRHLTASALSGLFTRGVLHKRGHRYVLAIQGEAIERLA